MNEERFRKSVGGAITSSRGFRVRVVGRLEVRYQDDGGEVRIDAERMPGRKVGVTLFADSIPERPSRTRAEVVADVRRAFDFAGWTLHVDQITTGR